MLTLTEGARELLDQHFENKKEVPAIRVYLAPGWGGAQLNLALDEQRENDEVFVFEPYTFIIDKGLLQSVAPIEIDGSPWGFRVLSKLSSQQNSGCASCSSCG